MPLTLRNAALCPKCAFPLYVVGYDNGEKTRIGHCQRCAVSFPLDNNIPCTSFAEHEYLKKLFYKRERATPIQALLVIVIPFLIILLAEVLGFWDWLDK